MFVFDCDRARKLHAEDCMSIDQTVTDRLPGKTEDIALLILGMAVYLPLHLGLGW